MAPLNLKISFDNGGILKTVKFETNTKVSEAHRIIEEKVLDGETGRTFGLFLTSSEEQTTGIWLERDKSLDYYMLRDGDTLLYLNRIRNLRVRLLDGSLKTLQVDESVPLSALMLFICSKIGITNHDEYGLCREEKEELDEAKPVTGPTLTLKRRPQERERERDTKMEQLRKKLKTDDEVQWLHSTKSLRELSVMPGETVLLKRRLFYSDRNVDCRDPVQLGLLYVQARDAILDGTHPITEAMACEFAGIQCQIQFGDHNEEKHTPDIFESKEFLPKDYCKNRGIKKKILQAHMKHIGLSELEAKALYTKTARSLPTYGVTFFLVKEKQKGKNRLVPRLLGINSESIQRLDENTKESLITWPLTHVQRWKANETTFTLDFGEYSDSQYACQTSEARRIDNVLKSYIDLILKKKKAADYFGKNGSEGEPMYIDTVGFSRANIIQHTSSNVSRLKEETFIGPHKIYSAPDVSQITMGNQIVTVRNLLVTKQMGSGQQAGVMGVLQPTLNSDVLNQLKLKQRTLAKLLTGVHTSAFKIVSLIADAGDLDEMELKREIGILNENFPDIIAGVNKASENDQLTDTAKSEMLKQLQELRDHLQILTTLGTQNPCQNTQEITDVATKLGNTSTKLFNTVDPVAKRRSALLMSSRNSFIEEDMAEAERDKTSLLLALGKARENLNRLLNNLHNNYTTPAASDQDLLEARRKLAKKIALLNAATASLLATHADAKEIDYTGAKTATDAIIELMPGIERDAKIIASADDSLDGDRVKENLRKLIDSVRRVLENVGSQDSEKLNDAAIRLGDTSKLFYELGYCYNDPEKENEIIKLTKTVDDKTSQLLLKTNEMAMSSEHGISSDVDAAGGRCIDASRRLVTCAQLTAPFIHESHCQSAMLSSANAVAESIKDLARSWKHLTTNCSKGQMQELVQSSMGVANALDALRDACSIVAVNEDLQDTETDYVRIKKNQAHSLDAQDQYNKAEINLLDAINLAQKNAKDVLEELNEPPKDAANKNKLNKIENDISQYLAQVNAAAGSLLTLCADPIKRDSHAEESKVRVIAELLPEIVKGLKVVSYTLDPVERDRRLDDARQLCHTAVNLCDSVKLHDMQKLNDSAVRFGDNSMKILFDLNLSNEEQRMMNITKNIDEETIDLLHQLNELTQNISDPRIAKDIVTVNKDCADAARRLQSYAMKISSINNSAGRMQMLNASEDLERCLDRLRFTCDALNGDSNNAARTQQLRDRIDALRNLLGRLRENAANEKVLMNAASETADKIRSAREVDNAPVNTKTSEELRKAATEKLASAANATAMLIVSHSDLDPGRPDIVSAIEALHKLGELIPSILDDVKSSSTQCTPEEKIKRMQATDALCDAADALCRAVSDADIERLNESSLAFGDASANLLYHLNRDAKPEAANKVIHTSKSIAIGASDLLSCASELADEASDPRVANDIDEAGTRCADAAGRLLSCAKLTAPFMYDLKAQTFMLNTIQDLENTLRRLEASCAPLDSDNTSAARTQQLRSKINALQDLLERLRSNTSEANTPLMVAAAEAAAAVRSARENLKTDTINVEISEQRALQTDAINKLARAGAATASLLVAHSDPKQPDASSATAALYTLVQLLPSIVDDVKSSSAGCPEEEKQKRMHLVASLCDAADALCQAVSDSDVEKLNESSLAFGDASSELAYCLNRDSKPEIANKVIDTSKSIANGASDLLLDTSELTKTMEDPIVAKNIDEAGSQCADSTGRLLTCAKLTSSFMHDAVAYTAMLNSIKDLDSSLERLESSYAPLDNDPANIERSQKLRDKINALRNLLERLRSNASAARSPLTVPAAEAAAAVRSAREHLKGDPIRTAIEPSEQRALQTDAVSKLARAGAATASLLAAHSDPKQPDTSSATAALHTLTQLLLGIVNDVKSSSAGCPEEEKQKRMHLVASLCDAADAVCQNVSDSDVEKLNESSLAFGDASSELAYCLNRDSKPEIANKVIDTSKSIANGASDLLLDTSELTKTMEDPIVAKNIDEAGSQCADSTSRLLTCAKLTSSFMHDSAAYTAMLNSIKDLDSSLERLESSYAPLDNDPANIERSQKLRDKINALRNLLERLRSNASAARSPLTVPAAEAAAAVRSAREHLNGDPIRKAIEPSEQRALQTDAFNKLARAGAAAASLLAAHSDPKQPDTSSATAALHTLTQLLPGIVNDVKSSSAGCPEEEKQKRMHLVASLCDAADAVCQNVSDSDVEKLNESSLACGDASSELAYCLNRDSKPEIANKVIDTSKSIANGASDLLLDTSELTKTMEDSIVAKNIDEAGSQCADSTGRLLTCAKLTAPFMHEPIAYTSMLNAIKNLDDSLQRLETSYRPLDNDSANIERTQKLRNKINALRHLLEGLRSNASETRSPLVAPAADAAAAMRLDRENLNRKHKLSHDLKYIIDYMENESNLLHDTQINTSSNDMDKFIENLELISNVISKDNNETSKELEDHTKSIKSSANILESAAKNIYSDPSVKKEIKEKCQMLAGNTPEILNLLHSIAKYGDNMPTKAIAKTENLIENYEKQIVGFHGILPSIKDVQSRSCLKHAADKLSEDCGRVRHVVQRAQRNNEVSNLEKTSGDLMEMERYLDLIFVKHEEISLNNEKALFNAESELMYRLATFAKNDTRYSTDLIPALRMYIYELGAQTDYNDLDIRHSVIIYIRRIIHLILVVVWYLIRYQMLNEPIDQDHIDDFVKSILREIEDGSNTALENKVKPNETIKKACNIILFSPRETVEFEDTRGSLVERIASEGSRLAASLPLVAFSSDQDAKSSHTASQASTRLANLFVQLSRDCHNMEVQQIIEDKIREVRYATFKLLRTGEFVHQDPNRVNSKRLLLDDCRTLEDAINDMTRSIDPKEQLIQRCDEIARGTQIRQFFLSDPMQPVSHYGLVDCLKGIQQQRDVVDNMMSEKNPLNREKFSQALVTVNRAVNKNCELAMQTAYLLAIQEQYEVATENGLPDTFHLDNIVKETKLACMSLLQCKYENQFKEKTEIIQIFTNDICISAKEVCSKIQDDELRSRFRNVINDIRSESNLLLATQDNIDVMPQTASLTAAVIRLMRILSILNALIMNPKLMPVTEHLTPKIAEEQESLCKKSRDINSKLLALLLKEIKNPKTAELDELKWENYGTYKRDLLESTDALIQIIRTSMARKSNRKESEDTEDLSCKDYLQKQVDSATKWLQAPCYDVKTKNRGIEAVTNLIDEANKLAEGLEKEEKEELNQLSSETRNLLVPCSNKYDNEKSRQLIDKLHELKKTIEMTVINRVVEGFIDDEEPLNELTTLIEYSSVKDKGFMSKLEKSIASLLEHLGKVTTTARIVAIGGNRDRNVAQQLKNNASQAELLAPKLVQAAKVKLETPDNMMALEEFITTSAEYSEAISRMRELCDQSVDPLDFVRTAGEMIQKMCEEANQHEPVKALTITRLANRVIQVGASESAKSNNEELSDALNKAKSRLKAVITAPDTRKSQLPDWRATTVEIIRSANEVESALNGETIFTKELDPDQPIFMAAHGLHAAVREWSARDNELVAVAKRMAVQMARLSECMRKDQKQALIDAAKSIVALSAEATRLARKLAMECTDVNLRKNLLQVCERIPTIGGQLKMLSTVKSTRFGNQGSEENQEAMTMLVGNAQNLMQTIEEVVKAAAGASVKIRSDRGSGKLSWVRKPTYY